MSSFKNNFLCQQFTERNRKMLFKTQQVLEVVLRSSSTSRTTSAPLSTPSGSPSSEPSSTSEEPSDMISSQPSFCQSLDEFVGCTFSANDSNQNVGFSYQVGFLATSNNSFFQFTNHSLRISSFPSLFQLEPLLPLVLTLHIIMEAKVLLTVVLLVDHRCVSSSSRRKFIVW